MATSRRGTTKKTTAAAKRAPAKKTTATRARKTTQSQQARPGDVDYTKSTNAYPMGAGDKQPTFVGPTDDDVDYSKSTMAYPMSEATPMRIVDGHVDDDGNPIDFAKSVDRYPMYGEYEQDVEASYDPEQPAEVRVPTPGPKSHGEAAGSKGWQAQRDRLGLDKNDPTGESDTDWKPEDAGMTHPDEESGVPHTTPAGEPQSHDDKHPDTSTAATESKVVNPPTKRSPSKQTQADGK